MRRSKRIALQCCVSKHVAGILDAEANRQDISRSALLRKYLEEIAMHLAHRYEDTDTVSAKQLSIPDLADVAV